MPVSGLSSKLAWGIESTYSTPVTPTLSLPILSEGIVIDPQPLDSGAIRADRTVMDSDDWRHGRIDRGGPVTMPLWDTGMEFLWRLAMGGYSYSVDTHTFTPGTLDQSATFVVGHGGSTSGVPNKTISGAVISGWTVTVGVDATPTMSMDIIGDGHSVADTGAVAGSEPGTYGVYAFHEAVPQWNSSSAWCVRSVTLSAAYDLADRVCLGSQDIADPRTEVGLRAYTGQIEVEFEDYTTTAPTWHADFLAGTERAFVVTLTSGSKVLTATMNARIEPGATPVVGGTDLTVVQIPVTFVGGTDAAAITVTINNGTSTL